MDEKNNFFNEPEIVKETLDKIKNTHYKKFKDNQEELLKILNGIEGIIRKESKEFSLCEQLEKDMKEAANAINTEIAKTVKEYPEFKTYFEAYILKV